MTAEEIFNQKITDKLNADPSKAKTINSVYQFDLLGDELEQWTIDLTKESDFVSKGASDKAACTVSIKLEDLVAIIEKKVNPQMAFMTGKLKVKGDMGLALKLGSIL